MEPEQVTVMATMIEPMPDRDDKTGKYTEEYSRKSFKQAIRELDRDAGTQAIADAVGCGYDTAYKKLARMEDAGEVASRKIGNARLWEVSDE